MKRATKILTIAGLLGVAVPALTPAPALAVNSEVEATIQSYGDLSMFYQGLLNTGVVNELNETTHYTMFIPTNAAFAQIRPEVYPCFYAQECRPQLAAMLRDHILVGRYELTTLLGQDTQSAGGRTLRVSEPYVGEFTVDGRRIISKAEVSGNIIYRIDSVIATPEELQQFQVVRRVPVANAVTTTVTKTYRTAPTTVVGPATVVEPEPYPGGSMLPETVERPGNFTETTTTVQHSMEPY